MSFSSGIAARIADASGYGVTPLYDFPVDKLEWLTTLYMLMALFAGLSKLVSWNIMSVINIQTATLIYKPKKFSAKNTLFFFTLRHADLK